MVKEVFCPASSWDLTCIFFPISQPIMVVIKSIPISSNTSIPNNPKWDTSTDGNFSSKRFFDTLFCVEDEHSSPKPPQAGSQVWRTKVNGFIKHFIWLAVRERLPTRFVLTRWKIGTDNYCTSCLAIEETLEHVLRTCSEAAVVWSDINLYMSFPATATLSEWLYFGCLNTSLSPFGNTWGTTLSFMCWGLWHRHN